MRFIKSPYLIHVRRPDQSAIQSVGPGVIRALDCRRMTAPVFFESRATMPAHIIKRSDFLLLISDYDQAFACNRGQEKVSRLFQLALMPDQQPLLCKNLLLFLRKSFG